MKEYRLQDRELIVTALTRPGNPLKRNEDALAINPEARIFGVIDGVSGMAVYEDEQGNSGGCIAARLLADELAAATAELDLREVVRSANAKLRQRMEEAGIDFATPWKRWGAVFAVFRLHADHLEFVQAGDCMLFARYRDGSVRAVTRNQVAEFDLQTLERKREWNEDGTLADEEIERRLKISHESNRNKANTREGYSVMNGDPALISFMESGRISLARVAVVYAVTDGMFHFIEHSKDSGKWETFVKELDEYGIGPYMDRLLEQENLDPSCVKYLRHKKSDDKSAVVAELLP
ncbi:protein phosphatase 2C domain-containing protein [Cohnella soli]|uniref:Protein phosphatase 2C domain-containing protein n=1 Tax=Cohnella soli TaxID=425005 RepID=A0ABW0HV57_9BACL